MQANAVKRSVLLLVVLLSVGLLTGCTPGLKKATPDRMPGYLYYPETLVNADAALKEAKAAGKDKECPAEYAAAKAMVDKGYEEYLACKNPAPITINIACPPKCEVKVNPSAIYVGESTKLTLTTTGTVTSAVLDGTSVGIEGGVKTVSPTASADFTAKAEGPGGSTSCTARVTVMPVPPKIPPTCELKADKQIIDLEKDKSVTLTIKTTGDVTSAKLKDTNKEFSNGTLTLDVDSPKPFTAEVSGPAGSATCSVAIAAKMTIRVNFPFDRPKTAKEAEHWFNNPDDYKDVKDKLDPIHKTNPGWTNKALTDEDTELAKAVNFIKAAPGNDIKLVGHTDVKGTVDYNQGLSDRRAKAVAGYLKKKVPGVRIVKTEGRGKAESLPDCAQTTADGKDNPDCRALNRRVVIFSTPPAQ